MRARIPEFHSPLIGTLMGIDNTIWIGLRVDTNAVRWVMLNDRGAVSHGALSGEPAFNLPRAAQ